MLKWNFAANILFFWKIIYNYYKQNDIFMFCDGSMFVHYKVWFYLSG